MRALTTLILQFLIKAWNFQNFIIFVTRNDFLTEALCTVTWVLTSAFFRLQNVFLQTMSTYISLEPQFNADQSFHGNYGLKMYGFQVTGGQSLRWHRHFSEEYFCCFFWHILTYIPLEQQFIAEQSFHGNYGLKMYDFQVTRGQSLPWHRHFSEEYFCFFWHILTYIPLERQFIAEQSFLGNHGLKVYGFRDTRGQINDGVIIFLTDVLNFPC